MKEHNPTWLAYGTRRTITSSVAQHLADTAHNVIPSQSFHVVNKAPANQPRSVQQSTIVVAEAIAIRHRDPILCRQKRFVRVWVQGRLVGVVDNKNVGTYSQLTVDLKIFCEQLNEGDVLRASRVDNLAGVFKKRSDVGPVEHLEVQASDTGETASDHP
ncbi:hypothetical protein T265_02247 [Opisthorchis viverrini]|uniref:Uncharacterized protein n=1 Tax=Opisthorchis viverrini TaxID=6198 RepID=A0A074ZVH5_OPIVI|nr:hypothetical protein T265_02247 [Opisthorchis viverrini]KER31473.1 hypothetical protein T265_02247 [Opisthorchis viverrini]